MEILSNKGGRPSGRIKTAKIEIRLEPTLKDEFMNQMRMEGKSASVVLGEWIKNYLISCKKDEKK